MRPELQPETEGALGDIIAPYLSEDGKTFAKDFWMVGRVGAMAGASVAEYNQANLILAGTGFDTEAKPLHLHILGPETEGTYWHECMVTPGDNGWNPRGATYVWNEMFSDEQNNAVWVACGCPSTSIYGEWGDQGVPIELQEWRRLHPSQREPNAIPLKGRVKGKFRGGRGR